MRLLFSLFVFLILQLSLKPVLAAQQSAQSGEPESTAQLLRSAEAAFERGRPDYILARQALDQAMSGDDLGLKYRANLLQARLDSTGRRYSRALPYYVKANAFRREQTQQLAAATLAEANTRAEAAEQARDSALQERDKALAEVEAERAAATWKYLLFGGIALALLVAGALAFFATTKKLTSNVAKAKKQQRASEAALNSAQTAVGGSALMASQQLRRLYQTIAARLPAGQVGSPANHVAAQNAALGYLKQSSFEQGGRTEVAMEAFFEKYNPDLARLLNPRNGATLNTNSMPLRLPIEQAVPVAFIYTELVANALQHGEGAVMASMTKEGQGITLTISDEGAADLSAVSKAEGLKLTSYFVDLLNARIDYLANEATVRVRFNSIMKRGAAASV